MATHIPTTSPSNASTARRRPRTLPMSRRTFNPVQEHIESILLLRWRVRGSTVGAQSAAVSLRPSLTTGLARRSLASAWSRPIGRPPIAATRH